MSRMMPNAASHDDRTDFPASAPEIVEEPLPGVVESVISAAVDLLRGLFPLPTRDAPVGVDYAAAIEERYSRPRRCC